MQTSKMRKNQEGFTLLELVIVLAIIAVVGGAALFTYGRLDEKMAKGRSAFDLSAIDRGVRLYKNVTGNYPDNLDLLALSDTRVGDVVGISPATATAGGFVSILPRELEGFDGNAATSDGHLHFYPATSAVVEALSQVGIDRLRGIASTDENGELEVPNIAFSDPPAGIGSEVAIVPSLVLSIIKSKNLGATDSGLLQAITGLAPDVTHLVVVLGLGNSASIVSNSGGVNSTTFAEAPFDSDVASSEYGRFLLLFHLGSDTNNSNTIDDTEIFETAIFVGAVDATGNWLEEQFKAAFDEKS